jgi:ech hydrogenase subunit A
MGKAEPMIPLYHGILMLFIVCAVVFSILIVPLYNSLVAPALAEAGYAAAFTTGHWFLKAPGLGIFAAWPIFVVVALALMIPSLRVKAKPEESRAAYMCGENVEVGADEFTAVADERTALKTGGFYAETALGEKNLNRFVIPIGIVFLIVLFAMVTI